MSTMVISSIFFHSYDENAVLLLSERSVYIFVNMVNRNIVFFFFFFFFLRFL